jgi:hypothetical protein
MTTRKLSEHGALVEAKATNGVFPIRIITEGEGSSGVYSRELLESHADVFANRAMFMNHPKDADKPWERDVTSIAAKLGPKVEYREVDGVAGLYGQATVDDRWRSFVENYSDVIGVSVYIAGDGKEQDGKYIVESFDGTDPYASVDFVVAAGRGGRVERMLESYRQIETSVETDTGAATADADSKEREQNMDELKALVEALTAKVDEKFVALEAKVDSVVQLSESATAADAAKVDALDVADKLAEAKLTESGRKRVLESVKSGAAVEDAIKTETSLRDEILAEARTVVTPGRVVESVSDDFKISGAATVRIGA